MKEIKLLIMLLVFAVQYNLNAGTIIEDALMDDPLYEISGIFGQHDFADATDAFDWAFTTQNGTSYQLQGNAATANDVFGWKKVTIAAPTPAWYMFQLHDDIDADGSKKFDWILASTNMLKKAAYKLEGVSDTGNFVYSSKLGIDYKINGDFIVFGNVGSFIGSSNVGALFSSIIGTTLYSNECGSIMAFVFGADGKLHVQQDGENMVLDYSIVGDTLETIGEVTEIHTILQASAESIKVLEADGQITMLYYDRNAAESEENENCEDDGDKAVIHHIEISPYPLATAADGGKIIFTATAVDGNSNAIDTQPDYIWSSNNQVAAIRPIDATHAEVTIHSEAEGTCAVIFVSSTDGQYTAQSYAALSGSTDAYPCPPE